MALRELCPEGAVGTEQWPSQRRYGQVALRKVTPVLWLPVNLPEKKNKNSPEAKKGGQGNHELTVINILLLW